MKERRRKAAALPRRLRSRGLKRKQPGAEPKGGRPAEGGRGGADGEGEAALPSCERLGQAKVQELPCRRTAMDAVFRSQAPAVGMHDLMPAGPWPMPGTVPARSGRFPWFGVCARRGRSAGDSSRAKALARQPCGDQAWQLTEAKHELEPDGSGWRCSRCMLEVRPQHAAQAERQASR